MVVVVVVAVSLMVNLANGVIGERETRVSERQWLGQTSC